MLEKYMDDKTDIFDCIISNKTVRDLIILLSHIVIALILVTMLKTTHPYILLMILIGILSYIIYMNKDVMPVWLLPTLGTLIFFTRVYIDGSKDYVVLDTNHQLKKIWEIPLWSILSYYIVQIVKKN